MAVQRRYPEELRRRAVRLVLDAQDEAGGRRGVCTRVGQQLGVTGEDLRFAMETRTNARYYRGRSLPGSQPSKERRKAN
jgi:transposase-like protein